MELFLPVKDLLVRSWDFLLKFVTAILIFAVGWVIAKFIKNFVVRILKTLRIDTIAEEVKIKDFLSKGGIRHTLSEIAGIIIYWVILLGVLVSSLNILSLTGVSGLLDRLLAYLPNVIGALVILILGTFISVFIGSVVRTAAANAGLNQAILLSKVAQIVIIAFAILITLEQLQIGAVLISAMNIVLAAIGLALALAFGLGCKEIAAKLISELIDKIKAKK